jgi:hypothetical protein
MNDAPSIAAKAALLVTDEWGKLHLGKVGRGTEVCMSGVSIPCGGAYPEADVMRDRMAACYNLLAGHDLSAVAIVPVGVMEDAQRIIRMALRLTKELQDSPRSLLSNMTEGIPDMEAVLAALSAKADAGGK